MANEFLKAGELGKILFDMAKEHEPSGSRRKKERYWRAVHAWLTSGFYG